MSALTDKELVVGFWTLRLKELLQERNNLNAEDVAYTAARAMAMKDKRLAGCIAELVGWGTDERAEMETFCAIALELMKSATPSRIRDAARIVEIRHLMKE
jgi:hypothetical protein